MSTANLDKNNKGVLYMLLAVALFAFGHSAVKWVHHIPFYQLVFLRAAIAIVIGYTYIRYKKISLVGHNQRLLILRGLVGTIALTTYFYSLQNMPLASAMTIQHLSPILTIIVAHFMLNERATKRQIVCFILAFIGVLMVKGFDARISLTAFLVSMVSIIASAFAYNFVRMLRDFDHEMVVVIYFPLVTLPIVGPFAVYNWVTPSLRDWLFIFVMGVFTMLAQFFMTMAYHRKKAAEVAIYNYLGVIIGILIGYYFFGETFSTMAMVGMMLIGMAVSLKN